MGKDQRKAARTWKLHTQNKRAINKQPVLEESAPANGEG